MAGRGADALTILAFALSALSKGIALTLPVVLLTLVGWRRGRVGWRDVRAVLPLVLISAGMTAVEVWTQHLVAGPDVRACR